MRSNSNEFPHSIPLLAPSRDLHVHRRRRNPHLFPPQSRSLAARKTHSTPLRPRVLVSGHRVSRGRAQQLHQDCLEVFEETGSGAEWDRDSAGKFGRIELMRLFCFAWWRNADEAVICRCSRLWRRRLLPRVYCSYRRMRGTTNHDNGKHFWLLTTFFVRCNGGISIRPTAGSCGYPV